MRSKIVLAFTLFVSCSSPVCACLASPDSIVLRGTLRSSTDVPQPGRRVRAEVAVGTCLVFRNHASTVTNEAGAMFMTIYGWSPDSLCVRLFASDTTASAVEEALADTLRVKLGGYPPDTLEIALRVPP